MKDDYLQFIGFALGGIIISMICNILLLRFARSLGIRNKNDVVIRWSNESKPSLGGVSFFVVFVFAAITYSVIEPTGQNIFQNREFLGLFVAGTLAFFMGLSDDAFNTQPLFKLLIQILCGVSLCWTDTVIHLTDIDSVNYILTIVWVILIMNSLNMLDNMDGITGTAVFFILIACIVSSLIMGVFQVDVWALVLLTVLGGVFGFLTMNVHPSKLFMGDAGSQFIGLFVAFFSVKYLWNISDVQVSADFPKWLGAFVTLVVFTPSGVDTLTVVINRLKKGQSPMVGGKDHTTHHLVYKGFSDFKVWLMFLAIAFFATVLATLMLLLIDAKVYLIIPFFSLYFIFVFYLLYRNTIRYPEPIKSK